MKPIWIIENFSNDPSYQEMSDEIVKQGFTLKEIKDGYKKIDLIEFRKEKCCVIFLGSITMTELVQKQLQTCFPVSYCNKPNYLCSKYMSHFGKYLFNDKYTMISLAELQRKKFFFYGTFGVDALIFVRPDSGQKPFQAQLLDMIDIDKFVERNNDIKHDMVVVSSPKTIIWEGRFVVTKYKEIIGTSTYRYQGQVTKIPSVPKQATELVKELLNVGYYPDSVFCIDICEDSDEKHWLLEINSFSSAGMYACKKDNIVRRVSEIAEDEWKIKNKIHSR